MARKKKDRRNEGSGKKAPPSADRKPIALRFSQDGKPFVSERAVNSLICAPPC
jgi:hypothetical protein